MPYSFSTSTLNDSEEYILDCCGFVLGGSGCSKLYSRSQGGWLTILLDEILRQLRKYILNRKQ
jgi:hypothetical protein